VEHLDHQNVIFSEQEKALLWGWDRRLWHYMRSGERVPLALALCKRLLGRAVDELAGDHPERARLHESAAHGFKLLLDRLTGKQSKAA